MQTVSNSISGRAPVQRPAVSISSSSPSQTIAQLLAPLPRNNSYSIELSPDSPTQINNVLLSCKIEARRHWGARSRRGMIRMAAARGHKVQRMYRWVEHSLRLSMIMPTLFIQRCLQGKKKSVCITYLQVERIDFFCNCSNWMIKINFAWLHEARFLENKYFRT